MDISLRQATLDDARLLFEWRNDIATRQNSRNTDPIEWDSHVKWLTDSMARQDRKIFIAYHNNIAVGTVRIDHFNGLSELSWTVAPSHRGEGLGTKIVQEAIQQAPDSTLCAVIKMDNAASISIAIKCGFYFDKMSNGLGVWKMDKRRGD